MYYPTWHAPRLAYLLPGDLNIRHSQVKPLHGDMSRLADTGPSYEVYLTFTLSILPVKGNGARS